MAQGSCGCRGPGGMGIGGFVDADLGRFVAAVNALLSGIIRTLLEGRGFLVSSPTRDFGSLYTSGRDSPEDRHNALAIEVFVLATQAALEGLAERIERAYRLRRSGWYRGCSGAGVWSTAAAILVQLHQDDPDLPLDPELYVAVQLAGATFDDPWVGLTEAAAALRYRARVREMIRGLRAELRAEVRFAELRVNGGEAIGKLLEAPTKRLSPLGCYIVALRAGCIDLGERFRLAAVRQHRSCPLYRGQPSPAQFRALPGTRAFGRGGTRRNDASSHPSDSSQLIREDPTAPRTQARKLTAVVRIDVRPLTISDVTFNRALPSVR